MNTGLQNLHAEAARLTGAGQYAQALALFERMTGLPGCSPDVWVNAAQLAMALGDFRKAAGFLEHLRPLTRQALPGGAQDHPVVAAMLAKCWRIGGRFDDVLQLLTPFRASVQASFEIRLELALAEAGTFSLDTALGLLNGLLREQPDNVEVLCHAGTAALQANAPDVARGWLERAMALAPDNPAVQSNYADLCHDQRRVEEAASLYRRLWEGNRLGPRQLFRFYMDARHIADWEACARLEPVLSGLLDTAVAGQAEMSASPFAVFNLTDDPQRLLACTEAAARPMLDYFRCEIAAGHALPAMAAGIPADAGQRLRIAYCSSNYDGHAGMHLIASMFRHHDRKKFEVIAVSYGAPKDNPFRDLVREQVDQFVDLQAANPQEMAQKLRALDIDILVDFRGFTEGSQLSAYPFRPARLHVTWLGYPGPMPGGLVDYQIVDPVVAPQAERAAFGSALAYLPTTYQMTDDAQPVGETVTRPPGLGGASEHFVFASFCQVYKIEPALFGVWMQILQAVPDSLLWLWCDSRQAQENLRRHAEAAGVAAERLVFATKVGKEEHLARVLHAELVLDTWRCGGHVTTTDMLWAGVPVIAKAGSHFASRVSQSLLKAAGLGELVAADAAGYRDLAIALARDPERLAAIRQRTEAARENSALFDTEGRVRELEALYRSMWQRHCEGLPPADIHLE